MRDEIELIALRANVPVEDVRALERRRTWTSTFVVSPSETVEARSGEDDEDQPVKAAPGEMRLSGYSAVFDSDSELLYGFIREQVKRGAFKRVLKESPDVRLLVNHEGAPHARTTNGTLSLVERPRGLFRDAVLDGRRQDSRDLYYGVERGDFSQSSFAFTIKRSEWRYCEHVADADYAGCECEWERDILEIGELLDDSVVTYPAYRDTTATVARESEPSGERNVLASDEEQRDTAPEADTSLTPSVSDPNEHAMRSRIARLKGSHSVTVDHGSARSRA